MLIPPFANAFVLTGPTGSGKSALAVRIAERIGAEIISMDSMAIYRGMDVGTAKPALKRFVSNLESIQRLDIGTAKATPEQRQVVPHHLLDVLEPWESGSVAWWLDRAALCSEDIESRGKTALFVGGTPLYLKALMFGLFDGPEADTALRQRLEQEALEKGPADLFQRLAAIDPPSAQRIHPNDLRRIVRALEVHALTGKPMSAWQTQWKKEPAVVNQETGLRNRGAPRCVWLDLPRDLLYERINRRVQDMFAAGWLEEARGLLALEKPLSREAAQALGYKEIFAYLRGHGTLDETIALVQTRTRQFAKRQITWFRHLPGLVRTTTELTETLWQPTM
ncbi:MAG: tRNA (adenosine(37)-N6)-dimethylallyltransferase MiaA [Gemmataceae bacterium]|nr:tRNA (adenosine(37)-N6)-dimethylallyltransferase MiaA [Gemmataceae bacterium]